MQPSSRDGQDALNSAALSAKEALLAAVFRGGLDGFDLEASEAAANYRLVWSEGDEEIPCGWVMEVFIHDTAAGGAGFAARVGEHIGEVVERAIEMMQFSVCGCESSCHGCLRSYQNRFFHGALNRHRAAELLAYALAAPRQKSMNTTSNNSFARGSPLGGVHESRNDP